MDRNIQTPSGRIHAVVSGTGPAVILVHGMNVELNSWRTWDRNIVALEQHFQVYALDLLGYGQSEKPEPRLDASGQVEALLQLLEAENLASANLVGLSWGGQIVQEVVLSQPAKVDKLVLVDSALDASKEGLTRLSKIRQPTLIIWDQDDAVIPVRASHVLKNSIPHSRLEILTAEERDTDADPQNRHWTQMSHSIRFNQLVTEFLLDKKK